MKQYTIVTTHYEVGGRYVLNPKPCSYISNYQYHEREDFLNRWEYILKNDVYFDAPRCFFINFTTPEIIEITDKLEELKNRI